MKIDLSVIIPTYNRENILGKTLELLCTALKDINSEIIVVNDYKEKKLNIEDLPKEVKIINNPKQGAASARNLGFSVSMGEFVLFLDDDMIVTDQVISQLLSFTKKNHKKIALPNWEYPVDINCRLQHVQHKTHQEITHAQK